MFQSQRTWLQILLAGSKAGRISKRRNIRQEGLCGRIKVGSKHVIGQRAISIAVHWCNLISWARGYRPRSSGRSSSRITANSSRRRLEVIINVACRWLAGVFIHSIERRSLRIPIGNKSSGFLVVTGRKFEFSKIRRQLWLHDGDGVVVAHIFVLVVLIGSTQTVGGKRAVQILIVEETRNEEPVVVEFAWTKDAMAGRPN